MGGTADTTLTNDEAAAALGVTPNHWRVLTRRYGVAAVGRSLFGRHSWSAAEVEAVRRAHAAAGRRRGRPQPTAEQRERAKQQQREYQREAARRARERLEEMSRPTLYGLLTAADVAELERRRAKFAAA